MPFGGKPILGIVGGIASGKSFVAGLLESLGCYVIDSDSIAHDIYRREEVIRTLRNWYGDGILDGSGNIDRRAVGARVFRNADERKRLETLLHPLIDERRVLLMRERVADDSVRAFVWDSPLLIEAGLHTQCDALIFIDTPHEIRLQRVRETRGWDAAELDRREKSQLPLQSKRQLAGEVVRGNAEEATLRRDLLAILERAVTSVADHNPGN